MSSILDNLSIIVHDDLPMVSPVSFMTPSRFLGSSLIAAVLLLSGTATASAADISLAVSGPTSVDRGQTYTYNLTVRNNESATFGDFNVVYNINGAGGILAHTTYQSTSRSCTVSNGSTVTCGGFTLSGYQEQSFTVTVRVNDNATCSSTIDFIGSIIYTGISQASRWSNTARAMVNCGTTSSSSSSSINNGAYVDLSITQSGPTSVNRGNSPRYTLTAYNAGNATANDVVISTTIPNGLIFQSSLSTSGCYQSGNNVYCPVGSIAAGANRSVDVTYSMPDSAYNCNDSYVHRGYVSTSSSETNGNNNSTSLTSSVTCGNSGNNNSPRGCVDIESTIYDLSGREIDNPGFTVSLSNGARITTDRDGRGRFNDVPVGSYNVTISLYSNYNLDSQSPNNGNIYVDDSGCERVYFRIISRTNSPYNNRAQCEDGIDNDGDRRYDYGGDTGCSSYSDNSEYDSSNGTYSSYSSRPTTTYYNNSSRATTYYNTDPYVAQVQNYANNNRRGGVTIDKRVDRLEVLPGGTVAYTITIRNNGTANVRDVELEDRYDTRMRVISLTQDGRVGGGRVIWNLGTIAAGGTKTVRFRMQLDGSLRMGDYLTNNATARGSFGTVNDSASVRVVSQLPATGFDLDSLFGGSTPSAALPIATLALLGLAGAGMGAGGAFGRRFL